MTNMEYFNEHTAKIFAKLYQEFPVKCELRAADFVTEGKDEDKSFAVWISTIEWLTDQDYMTYNDSAQGAFYIGSVLTDKGLEVLNQVPDSLNPQERYGDKLLETIEDSSLDAAKSLIGDLFSKGLSMAMTGLS